MTGKVFIVGAGCGKADMMSLRAINAVKNAEVVVHDRLLGDGVLELIPETAEKINAGKASSNHLIPQEEINKILLEKAKEGKNVVRLKGGDPFVFGRGGEETEFLRDNNIDTEVIPGISSALAVPELAGIPVTHRGVSSSVHILTGHFKDDKKIDFAALKNAGGTFVFLMGLENAPNIQNGFLSVGMDKNMPCAVLENGGTAKQRVGICTLENLAETAKTHNSPSIIVVGEVCALHEKLYTKRPLQGRHILIARPKDHAANLKIMLENAGAAVSVVPSIKIEPYDIDVNEIKKNIIEHDYIVFTSRTGVELVMEKLFENGFDARIFGGKKIAVIGKGTAKTLRNYGLNYDIMPKKSYSDELANLLVAQNADNILLLRAENGLRYLDGILNKNNIKFKTINIYKTVQAEQENIPEFDTAVFASPSEAEFFEAKNDSFKAVCIGKYTLAAAQKRGFDAVVAEECSDKGLFDKILKEVEK